MITADDLQGHWRRDWIRAPGFEDRTTHVHWMQAGALFADLRVPVAASAPLSARCLADCDGATLAALLECEGFAGEITVAAGQCTWHRRINWQGAQGRPDVGAMSFGAGGVLIEDGVHADYREAWVAQPAGSLRGHRIGWRDLKGVLIEGETGFLFGLGPAPRGDAKALAELLASGALGAEAARETFDSFYAFGHWDGATGIADLSTHPFARDLPVLDRSPRGFVWHAPLFAGGTEARPLETITP